MVKKKKMKLGTKIAIGFGVVAAGLGALLYYLSTRARGEEIVVGKTYYFDYIPGVLNVRNFVTGANFPYSTASEVVASIEGGTGIGTGSGSTKITSVNVWDPGAQNWFAWGYSGGKWRGTNSVISPGDGLIIFYISSFSWTP